MKMLSLIKNHINVAIIAGAVVAAGFLLFAFNAYTNSVKASVIGECNTTQLEEELRFAQKKADDLEARTKVLQEIIDNFEPETVERIEFRDRVITEIREIEAEVQETKEGQTREEISPSTRAFLDSLMGDSNE